MIIDSLSITDYKNYRGNNTIDLSVSPSNNIILIGGYNGSGKTTLSEAIKLCLYGNRIFGHPLSEAKYQEYLHEVHCKEASDKSGFSISMRLILNEEKPAVVVNITRLFKKNRVNYDEQLVLKKDDSEVELIDENYWDYYVEKLIPPNVSRYFFFDGETVKDTLTSDGSEEYLTSAINDLSGVTDLINLKKDLLEVRKKILSKSSKTTGAKKIKDLSAKIDDYKILNQSLSEEIEDHLKKIGEYKTKKDELDQLLKRATGVKESKNKELTSRLSVAIETYDKINQDIADFCYSKMLYRVASKNLFTTIHRAKKENSNSINTYAIELLNKIKSSTNNKIKNKIESETIDSIIKLISGMKTDEQKPILDLTLPRITRMEGLFVSDLAVDNFLNNMKIREFQNIMIHDLKNEIAKFNDQSTDDLVREIDEIVSNISSEETECDRIMSIQDFNTQQIEITRDEIKKEERKTLLSEVDRAAIENIDLFESSINDRISLFQARGSSTLVKKINEMYSLLKNKKDMVKEIKLSGSHGIELFNYSDESVNVKMISEGEKGILMYSIIYGLHSISGSHLPLIIDSPLGRMDSLHVENLITKFYPTAAEQVIILSHDREVTGEYQNMIRNSLSHEYLIAKDTVPKINTGYFKW